MSDEIVYLKSQVGQQANSPGAEALIRAMADGSICVTPMRGAYAELALRGKLFYSFCLSLATSVPATAQIGNIVWNPPGSGVNLVFYKWAIGIEVGAVEACLGITFGYSAQATTPTTVTVANATGCTLLNAASPSISKAKAYGIGTIVTAPTPVMNLVHTTAAIDTVGVDSVKGDFEGIWVIPPGYLAALSAITNAVDAAGMTSTLTWEEVPVY